MENKPEYIGLWFGLSKLGVISALINSNLRNRVLIHSIEIAKPKVLIYASELTEAIDQVKNDISQQFDYVYQGNASNNPIGDKLEDLLENVTDVCTSQEKVYGHDILMFIYTSGTTGLPK